MVWQDIIITIIYIIFVYALIPQVLKGFKEKKPHINFQTGLLNTIAMYALAIAFFSLGLLFSGIIGTLNATMWLILFIQSIIYK
tara:strand:- start:3463 stop:3714 length:252 start_codon:yes stop_codon:yes gene_type:complete